MAGDRERQTKLDAKVLRTDFTQWLREESA
jgi:hypothetical protein